MSIENCLIINQLSRNFEHLTKIICQLKLVWLLEKGGTSVKKLI